MYTNLGDDSVAHALNETDVSVVVTSHELLPRFKAMLPNLPKIKTIIYMEDQLQKTSTAGFKEGVDIIAFRSVVSNVSWYHGGLERANLQKKMPGSNTYIFYMYIPLGNKKRPNENILSIS